MRAVDIREGAQQALAPLIPFCNAAAIPAARVLRESHGEKVDGENLAETGQNHRIKVIRGLAGLILPSGTVTIEGQGPRQPRNTSWLRIPTETGDILAPSNCIKFFPQQQSVYRLSRGDVTDLADFDPSPPLIEMPLDEKLHHMLGLRWTFRPSDNSMSFLLRLLCGTLDFERRLFYAYAERDIVKLDTRLDEVRLGQRPQPEGPVPDLRSKRRTQGS